MPFDYRIVKVRNDVVVATLLAGDSSIHNFWHAVAPDGTYYGADIDGQIFKAKPDGTAIRIAVLDEWADNVTPAFFGVLEIDGLAVGRDGLVYASTDSALIKLRQDDAADLVAGHARDVGLVAGVGGPQARFRFVFTPVVSRSGNVYFSDTFAHKIMKVRPDGFASVVAGGGTTGSQSGYAEGIGTDALFNTPWGIAVDDDEVLWVCDRGNGRIRKIEPGGQVSTIAGSGNSAHVDGQGPAAKFVQARFVALDPNGRFAYVMDRDGSNRYISRVDEAGNARTIKLITDPVTTIQVAPDGELTYLGIFSV
jgi:hypothetical protein